MKNNRVAEKYITNQGYEIEIIEYFNCTNCTIKFNSGLILKNKIYSKIVVGNIKNPEHVYLCGRGFTGLGNYKLIKNSLNLKIYEVWTSMINRCYSVKSEEKYPTYKDCSVTEEWYNFQNFAKWFEENYNTETMQSWQLDKDILIKGNKVYSLSTCCFVPQEINSLFTKKQNNRGLYPIGVTFRKKRNRFRASIGKITIGSSYITPEEAFQAYKTAKEKRIKEIAEKWKPCINPKVYQAMYNYKVEITD